MLSVTSATRRRAAGAVALVLLTAAAACSSGSSGSTAARPAAPPEPPFAVATRHLTLVDRSRPTPAVPAAHVAARPDRTIAVDLYYPAAGRPGPEPTGEPVTPYPVPANARPAAGRFPVVVFAHGFASEGADFRGFAERWARQGYAVALPTFPLSRRGIAYSPDYVHQPGDVSFVVDQLAALDRRGPLAGRLDTGKLVVAGHSLGSATVVGTAYNSCCVDRRIDGVISVSGGPLAYPGGSYDHRPATPMLLVHGEKDTTVPVGAGNYLHDQHWAPMWYLRPHAADHVGVFTGEPGRLFEEAALAFLADRLRGDPSGLARVGADVRASGAADWLVR